MHKNEGSLLPELIVRVGVTGHRPSGINAANEAEIRASVAEILEQVVGTTAKIAGGGIYTNAAPVLRVVSSLAEGADRIVCESALALRKDRLIVMRDCVLPAARDEYRKDFPGEMPGGDLDILLQHARVFELCGQRAGPWLRSADYAHAGHLVVSNCDVLVAIWDGSYGGEGSPGEIVREAMQRGVPVVRVDLRNPRTISYCGGHEKWQTGWEAALATFLLATFQPPAGAKEWVDRYRREQGPVHGDRRRADDLALRFGTKYRRSYKLKYWLAAFAVACAASGLRTNQEDAPVWPVSELLLILGVGVCYVLPHYLDWHERWLDYRLLAEQFRVLEFLHPLGETVPVFHPPKYWGVPTKRHSCVRWYFRARLRERGVPNAVVTPEYVRQCQAQVLAAAQAQIIYNRKKHSRTMRFRWLERAGWVAFLLTFLACLAHLLRWWDARTLGAITAALPAFGAAIEGLGAQAEIKRIEEYTHAMLQHLEDVQRQLEPLRTELEPIREIAFDLATEMTWETSGWHNLIHGQPPKLS